MFAGKRDTLAILFLLEGLEGRVEVARFESARSGDKMLAGRRFFVLCSAACLLLPISCFPSGMACDPYLESEEKRYVLRSGQRVLEIECEPWW